MISLLFWILTLAACAYAVASGGKDGLWAATLVVAPSVLTIPAGQPGLAWGSVQVGIVIVDTALLAGLYALVLHSRRWWPIWMTGFHLLAVAAHLAASLTEGFLPKIYYAAATFSAVPVPVAMVIGIMLDRRAGVAPPAGVARHDGEIRYPPG
mgnify:FL=1